MTFLTDFMYDYSVYQSILFHTMLDALLTNLTFWHQIYNLVTDLAVQNEDKIIW